MHRRAWFLAHALAAFAVPAHAVSVFVVSEPWVRVAADGRSAEGFMQLRSSDGAALVAVKSDSSRVVMRPPGQRAAAITTIPLAAGATVMLAPGSYRLGLPRLDRSLKLGDRVLFTLTVEATDGTRQEITANAEVRRRSPTDDHLHPQGHAHSH